jgi:hypothetical protein
MTPFQQFVRDVREVLAHVPRLNMVLWLKFEPTGAVGCLAGMGYQRQLDSFLHFKLYKCMPSQYALRTIDGHSPTSPEAWAHLPKPDRIAKLFAIPTDHEHYIYGSTHQVLHARLERLIREVQTA